MMSMSIANRIQDARKRANLTQFQLAQKVGVSAMTPSRWETGASKPRRRQVVAVAEALGITVEELTQDEAEAAMARAAEELAAVIHAALRGALSENRKWHDRRQAQAPISVERRRAVSA